MCTFARLLLFFPFNFCNWGARVCGASLGGPPTRNSLQRDFRRGKHVYKAPVFEFLFETDLERGHHVYKALVFEISFKDGYGKGATM